MDGSEDILEETNGGMHNYVSENNEDCVQPPKVGMTFDSLDEAFSCYSRYAKQKGFAIHKRSSAKGPDGKVKYVSLSCIRGGKAIVNTKNLVKPRPQSRIQCPAHARLVVDPDGKYRLTQVKLDHNHDPSPTKAKYLKSYRVIDEHTKRRLELNDAAGINLNKSFSAVQIELGPDSVSFTQKDCRNYLDSHRRLSLVDGDAVAMSKYFMKMQKDNADFFFSIDLDNEGRLKNVFWADARSRAAAKEFGDVVTFDTTYIVNRYDMPFAPFVGVNHHGQSILLGCGLISHEDIESFSWLFATWEACMWDCPPNAIITDQCMAMKNAIEKIFPLTRHRWCIWHIMKKIPEKMGGFKDRENISMCMRRAVYNSITVEEFESAWDLFIEEYGLQRNTWLKELYAERRRWVPAYLKDVFFAGMSSTQRSESMNGYFDGYIHSKTTLKQFVEQYENALAKKVEAERLEDVRSWHSFIPLIQEADELEKQFQSVYTNEKVREFQQEFVGKLNCLCEKITENDLISEYDVTECIVYDYGEEKRRKQVTFRVAFHFETNETYCTCRLFEFKGMVCRHQLLVWHNKKIEKVPEKYVFRRWCKNVKRAHTKIRISYDILSRGIDAQRHGNMCNVFKEVADLADESEVEYNLVMTRIHELKLEVLESLSGRGSEMSSKTTTDAASLEDDLAKESVNIRDPKSVKRRGRPRSVRIQGAIEKNTKRKIRQQKKTMSETTKDKELLDNMSISHSQFCYDYTVNTQGSFAHNYNTQSAPIANSQPVFGGHLLRGFSSQELLKAMEHGRNTWINPCMESHLPSDSYPQGTCSSASKHAQKITKE